MVITEEERAARFRVPYKWVQTVDIPALHILTSWMFEKLVRIWFWDTSGWMRPPESPEEALRLWQRLDASPEEVLDLKQRLQSARDSIGVNRPKKKPRKNKKKRRWGKQQDLYRRWWRDVFPNNTIPWTDELQDRLLILLASAYKRCIRRRDRMWKILVRPEWNGYVPSDSALTDAVPTLVTAHWFYRQLHAEPWFRRYGTGRFRRQDVLLTNDILERAKMPEPKHPERVMELGIILELARQRSGSLWEIFVDVPERFYRITGAALRHALDLRWLRQPDPKMVRAIAESLVEATRHGEMDRASLRAFALGEPTVQPIFWNAYSEHRRLAGESSLEVWDMTPAELECLEECVRFVLLTHVSRAFSRAFECPLPPSPSEEKAA